MTGYFIRRFLLVPPTLIGVTLLVFIITRFVPGGPLEQAIAQMRVASSEAGSAGIGQEMNLTEEQLLKLKKQFGFDKPWYQAYPIWLWNTARGDLGNSFRFHEPVSSVIAQRLPVSCYYGIVTLIITYMICIPLGVAKAVRHQTWFDNVSSAVIFIGYAVPSYVLGVLLWAFFAAYLEWFPSRDFVSFDFADKSFFGKVGDLVSHSVLPLASYLIGEFAFVTFLMKNHLMENLSADYMRTAIAKGVPFRQGVWRHAFGNSLIPIATNVGHQVSVLLAGSFLIENIFNIDGFGLLGFESVVHRDYPVVMGIALISALLMLLGNILSDVLVALVDPRVKFQ